MSCFIKILTKCAFQFGREHSWYFSITRSLLTCQLYNEWLILWHGRRSSPPANQSSFYNFLFFSIWLIPVQATVNQHFINKKRIISFYKKLRRQWKLQGTQVIRIHNSFSWLSTRGHYKCHNSFIREIDPQMVVCCCIYNWRIIDLTILELAGKVTSQFFY